MIAWLLASVAATGTAAMYSRTPAVIPYLAVRSERGSQDVKYGKAVIQCIGGRLALTRTSTNKKSTFLAFSPLEIDRVVVYLPGFATTTSKGLVEAHRLSLAFGPRDQVVYVDWGGGAARYGYARAARAARVNSAAFAAALATLHRGLPGRELDVFAHSMGARVAANAMAQMKPTADRRPVVARVVLAAPDMGLAAYRRAIARLPGAFGHVTIYSSRHDNALLLASVINLHRRVGQLAGRKALANTDVVDSSSANPGNAGHGYALVDDNLMHDVAQVLAGTPTPHRTWKTTRLARIWTYEAPDRVRHLPPTQCDR